MGRKFDLKQTLRKQLSLIREGRPDTRRERERVMLVILEDLAHLKLLPSTLYHIEHDHIQSLVDLWKKNKESSKYMMNKLAVLRSVNRLADFGLCIPKNKALGLSYKIPPKDLPDDLPAQLNKTVQHSLTRSLINMQLHFGLSKMEAIHIDLSLSVKTDGLLVHRLIAHNSKDRSIPIETEQQKQTLKEHAGFKTSIQIMGVNTVRQLYLAEMAYLNYPPTLSLRYYYGVNRKKILVTARQYSKETIDRKIAGEMGVSVFQLTKILDDYEQNQRKISESLYLPVLEEA